MFSLWRKARRENSAASRLLGSTSLRFALHGWQRVLFPNGFPYTEPDDRMSHKAAGMLLKPSASRDRLTQGIFITDDARYRQGIVEQAFEQAAIVAPVEKTLRSARRSGVISARNRLAQAREALEKGLITEEELKALETMRMLRRRVIAVDSFEDYGKQHLLQSAPITSNHVA
ncbi:acyl-CoA dehydrogenase domain-containing protein [Thiolapillus sp.]|uniref:acyl-CoA dehydrogenase domain-containing protein n=1 Tax=Thiolapillus sp. TaxID=2017437 RepID=UPI003AF86D9A